MTLPPFSTVTIIGLGLIGGSMARRIREALPETKLYAVDNQAVLSEALAEGIIDSALEGMTDLRLLASDLILIGTHMDLAHDVLAQLAELPATEPLNVMDLGSTKEKICVIADSLMPAIHFIGGHPLAGREVSGFANSRAELFIKKRFLLTPCQATPVSLKERTIAWLESLDMVPVILAADRHDKLMALVSHFPQLYAVALANLLHAHCEVTPLQFLGGGIDDQMRLMASPYAMWHAVFCDNTENLESVLTEFINLLTQLRDDLKSDSLKPWFDTSHSIYTQYQEIKANR